MWLNFIHLEMFQSLLKLTTL